MNKFLLSNTTGYRLLRTIAQGIIGVIIANVDLLISSLTISSTMKPVIVALVMAILSPIMATLKGEELPANYFEEEGADDGNSK